MVCLCGSGFGLFSICCIAQCSMKCDLTEGLRHIWESAWRIMNIIYRVSLVTWELFAFSDSCAERKKSLECHRNHNNLIFFKTSAFSSSCVWERSRKRFQYFDEFSPFLIYLHVEETAMLSHGEVVTSVISVKLNYTSACFL